MVPNELNVKRGGICVVGRDPGSDEVRQGKPFVGRSGRLLMDALAERGLRRKDVNLLNVSRFRPNGNNFNAHPRHQLENEVQHLRKTLQELQPSVVLALGNEAAWVVCEDWPDTKIKDNNGRDLWIHTGDIFGASQIMQRRGYVFDSPWFDAPVVAAIHPAAASRQWKPLRALISMDIARAKKIHREGFERPTRKVCIVSESCATSKMSKVRK